MLETVTPYYPSKFAVPLWVDCRYYQASLAMARSYSSNCHGRVSGLGGMTFSGPNRYHRSIKLLQNFMIITLAHNAARVRLVLLLILLIDNMNQRAVVSKEHLVQAKYLDGD